MKRGNLCITMCSIEDINRPLCVIPRLEYLKIQYLPNLDRIKGIKMWALDLKYVDRNSWENYHSMYSVATIR